MQNTDWINHEIYLRRQTKIAVPNKDNASSPLLPSSFLLQFNGNLSKLGYVLSPELAYQLERLPQQVFLAIAKQTIANVRKMVGDWVEYKPMYPNFPEQVKELSRTELRFNAAMHYLGDWFGVRILPNLQKDPRPPLDTSHQEFNAIKLGNASDFFAIFDRLLASRFSWSVQDKEDIAWLVSTLNYIPIQALTNLSLADWLATLAQDNRYLTNKENQATWLALLLRYQISDSEQILQACQTATDILRVAVAWSEGDVSLAAPTRFKAYSRSIRKALLTRLESVANQWGIVEDMNRYPEYYKRLGERLHPGEYSNKYPKTYAAFKTIREKITIDSFNHRVESSLTANTADSFEKLVSLLQTRPGELARRLDKLLRMSDEKQRPLVLARFETVIDDVATNVLLQMHAHFSQRSQNRLPLYRIFFPKGQVSKLFAKAQDLPELSQEVCEQVNGLIEMSLVKRFADKPPLGKVYIDPELKNFPVPLVQRTASKALQTIPQGSFLALPDAKTLRLFVYWKQGDDRADIDLSAVFLADDFSHLDTVSYYNLTSYGGYHSGDITSAPDGASEFIDIELANLKQRGVRYVMMLLNSYTVQPYCDLPICFAGLMARRNANSGEIYEPSTVTQRFDVSSNSTISIPLIVDLELDCWQWTDLTLTCYPNTYNNVVGNLSNISMMGYAMQMLRKVSLYQLFAWHAQARGQLVDTPEQADTLFLADNAKARDSMAQGKQLMTAFDIDKINSTFL